MSGKLSGHQTENATPQPAISLSQPGLLQRTCECGGVPGLTGECEECSGKRLSGQRGSNPPALPNNPPDDQPTGQIQRSTLGGYSFGKLAIAPKERYGIQTKLAIGQPNDRYEQEADRVANQVMRMPAPDSLERGPLVNSNLPFAAHQLPVQKQEAKEEDEEKKKGKIQSKEESGQTPRVTAELEQQLQASQGKGQPLPEETRSFMKSRFGQDFNHVRVHADGEAAQMNRALNAQAFTHRQDVYFGADKYSPQSVEGQRLLAHELTHVVQQTGRIQTSLVARQLNQTILQREEEKGSAGNQGDVRETTDQGSEATRGTKTIKAKPPLPPGNWEIIGYDALVRVSWLVEDGWSRQAGDDFKLPTVIETLVRAGVKKLGFNWVTDEAIAQKLPDIVISLPAIEEDVEVIEINLINLFKFFGPPDDMQVYWVPQGDGMLLVLRAETLRGTPIAARESGVMTIRDAAFNQRILAQLEARTGLTARSEHRAAFLSHGFPVNPNDLAGNGVLLPYPREMFEFLFGKDTWDTWLKNQKQGKEGGKVGKEGEKKGGIPGGVTGGVAGGKPGGNEEALKRLRSVYEFLIASFPEQLKDKSFDDFVNYLRSHADLVKAKADTPWPKLDDPEIWRSFADAWAEGRKLPPEALSAQPDSWLRPGYVFKPNGEIVISPEIEDYRYITGATIEVRMEMRSPPAENLLVNAFPRKANFRWDWSGPAGGLTGLVGGLGDTSGNNERSVELKKPGVYTLSVNTSSIYFRGGEILTRSRTITVVDPGKRIDEVFGERTESGYGPFERAPDGSLRLRASLAGGIGEQAMSFEARKKALLDQISRIEALVNDGKITRADAKEAIDLINDQIKKIEEFKVKAGSSGRAYVVDGVFLSEETSSYFPLKLSMYGTVISDGDELTYQILIADLTSLGGAPRYLDSASGSAGRDEAATRAQLEKQAIKNACEEFRKANVYPNGRVRLAIQLHDGTGVFTHDFTTHSARKKAKYVIGVGGMIVGGVGIVAGAIFTEGTTTPLWVKVIMASAVLAGLADVGLNVEQRIRTGQSGDKWTVEAVDVAMVATSVMGLRALASAKPVAGGFHVAMKWGDRSLVSFLSISVKADIDAADAECTAQIAAGVDRTKAEAERNQKVAAILQGAAINGGFMLFAHVAQAHGGRVGAEERGVSRRNVRQEIAELAATGTPEQIKSKVMESKLSADERALLTEALATASERKLVAEAKAKAEPAKPPGKEVPPEVAKPEAPKTPEVEAPKVEAPKTPEVAKPPEKAPPAEPAKEVPRKTELELRLEAAETESQVARGLVDEFEAKLKNTEANHEANKVKREEAKARLTQAKAEAESASVKAKTELEQAKQHLKQSQKELRESGSSVKSARERLEEAKQLERQIKDIEIGVKREKLNQNLDELNTMRKELDKDIKRKEAKLRTAKDDEIKASHALRKAEQDVKYGMRMPQDVPERGVYEKAKQNTIKVEQELKSMKERRGEIERESLAKIEAFQAEERAAKGITPELYEILRKNSPSPKIRKEIQSKPPIDEVYGFQIEGTPEADHIVSMHEITQMPGFNLLKLKQQLEVLNLRENFMVLDKRVNSSKGDRTFSQWEGHPDFGEINPKAKQKLLEREAKARELLGKAIEERKPK